MAFVMCLFCAIGNFLEQSEEISGKLLGDFEELARVAEKREKDGVRVFE